MTLTVPCLFGLESLVADEMRRLNLKDVRAENGRVHCDGTLADIARLNINLRCGARVLMELGSFPARDFEALFQGVYALPWEHFIPRDGEFPVKGYSLNSQLHSVPACQAIVKKASAKRLGEKYGLETLPESGSRYQIQFAIIKDVATLYLDTSGEGLYKRGYRARNMGAPLRETLAAALVTLPVLAAAFLLSKPMAAYQMGESYARSVGVPVRAFSTALVLLSSLLSACVTAFAGPISFVGIAVPHLVKSLLGSAKPLYVLPGCCLGGAAFCLLCDLIARSLFAPTELSISSVTAVFGAPVVIWLLVRRQTEGGRE